MKKLLLGLICFQASILSFTQVVSNREKTGEKVYGERAAIPLKLKQPQTPDETWGQLFVDVQLKRALGDNKTFVDAIPKYPPATILAKYKQLKPADSAALRTFVEQNFKVPLTINVTIASTKTLKEHLEALWPALTRKADVIQPNSSLLPLPKPYVVPGGRFREIYYWDSYFTMLGLATSNRYDLIESMLDNFSFLISRYGHIPNGNRSYYLSRSQPPYFALMVDLLRQKKGNAVFQKYYGVMLKEYDWWMEGEAKVSAARPHRRVVRMMGGEVLNRYWDDKRAPREESYYEDVQNGLTYKDEDQLVYTHLRAGAESGWDFSSRWLADTFHLNTIQTTNIVPVDLNCLLFAYENILSNAARTVRQNTQAETFSKKATARKSAILKYFWNDAYHYFFDVNLQTGGSTGIWSISGVLPLFTKIASPEQAAYVKNHIENKFVKDGGVVTTIYQTGQQWDAPNGWAPLQYLTVQGLLNYGYSAQANSIAGKWMSVNEKVYASTGKMLEKYNVEDIHLESGGGEYPTQDGFGWSNGVYLKFYQMFRAGK